MTRTAAAPVLSGPILEQIEEHVFSETDREVGGVLVGTLVDGELSVRAAIPALRATESAMNVTFTHEVWADVLDAVERDHPDSRIVGWYHSHPGFGLFLSEYDKFIQANFFGEPGMAALVMDPLAGDYGWFTCVGDQVIELDRHPTTRPAVEARASEVRQAERVRRSNRGRLLATGAVFTSLVAVAGYAIGNLTAPAVTAPDVAAATPGTPGSPDQVAELEAQLDAANARIDELQVQGTTATITYKVAPGESWWSIAEELTGDGSNFRRLIRANPDMTSLDPGDVIAVPGVPVAEAD